jgi:peptide/nickel transport system permease protein
LELAAAASLLMVALGISLGFAMATIRSRPFRFLLDGANAVLLACPPFLTGLFLIVLLGIVFRVFPASGEVSIFDEFGSGARYLFLPALAIALPHAAALGRLVASGMRATASEDFIDLAVAKGVAPRRVWVRHVLRNSMAAPVATIGLRIGELLAGAIVVEAIFGRHGLGELAVTSVSTRDYFVIQTLIVGAVLVAAVMQLLSEVGVALLDPRVRLGSR